MSLSTGLAIIFGTLFAVAFGLFLLVSLPFAAIAALIQYRGNLSNYFRRGISSGGIWMRDRVVSAPVIFLLMGALWLIDLRRKIRSP